MTDNKSPSKYLYYDTLEWGCRTLAARIQLSDLVFDCILAVTGNGLFVAHLLSQFLNIPEVWTIGLEVEGDERPYIHVPNPMIFTGRTVLIVDFLAKTGRTLQQVEKLFSVSRPKVSTASAVFYWCRSSYVPDMSPNFYVEELQEEVYLIFPWTKRLERKENNV